MNSVVPKDNCVWESRRALLCGDVGRGAYFFSSVFFITAAPCSIMGSIIFAASSGRTSVIQTKRDRPCPRSKT